MVTAEVKDGKPEVKNYYPCLKIDESTGLIVLFTEYDSGVVVAQGDDIYPVGDSSPKWGEIEFMTFTGSITLRNS